MHLPTVIVAVAHKAALLVDAAHGVEIIGVRVDVAVKVGGFGSLRDPRPAAAGCLAIEAVVDRVLDSAPCDVHAVALRGELGDLRRRDTFVLDAPAIGVEVADKAARAVDAADGVDIGLAGGDILIEEFSRARLTDAQPIITGAAIDAVRVDIIDRVPFQSDTLGLADRLGELRRVNAQIGVLPAGGVILADEVALCVHTADGVGIGAVFAHVGVNIGGVGGLRHLPPAVS